MSISRKNVGVTLALLTCAADIGLASSTDSLVAFYAAFAVSLLLWLSMLIVSDANGVGEVVRSPGLRTYVIVGATALTLRVICASLAHPISSDRFQYHAYEIFFSSGKAPWRDFVFTYPQGAALLFASLSRLPHVVWPALIILADTVTALLVVSAAGRYGAWSGLVGGIAYALCPFPILESAVNAHLDILVGCVVAAGCAAYLSMRYVSASAALSTAAMLKGWPIALFVLAIASLRSPRTIIKMSMAGLLTIGLLTLPFASAVRPLEMYWMTLLPIGGGSSIAGVAHGSSFMQNSLFWVGAEWPWLHWLVPLAFVGLITAVPAALLGRSPGVFRLLWALPASALVVMGISIACTPLGPSAATYHWWTPSSVFVARGLYTAAFAFAALFSGYGARLEKSGCPTFLSAAYAVTVLLMVLHGNTFGWYFLPAVALLAMSPPGRGKWFAAAAIVAFTPAFTSSDFRYAPIISRTPVTDWRITRDTPKSVVVRAAAEGKLSLVFHAFSQGGDRLPVVRARGSMRAGATPRTALMITRRSNIDPTFGGNPVAFSLYLEGLNARGNHVRVPLALEERTTAADYDIFDRYPLQSMRETLTRVDHLDVDAHMVRAAQAVRFDAGDIGLVEQPLWMTGDSIALICALFALGMVMIPVMSAPERKR